MLAGNLVRMDITYFMLMSPKIWSQNNRDFTLWQFEYDDPDSVQNNMYYFQDDPPIIKIMGNAALTRWSGKELKVKYSQTESKSDGRISSSMMVREGVCIYSG